MDLGGPCTNCVFNEASTLFPPLHGLFVAFFLCSCLMHLNLLHVRRTCFSFSLTLAPNYFFLRGIGVPSSSLVTRDQLISGQMCGCASGERRREASFVAPKFCSKTQKFSTLKSRFEFDEFTAEKQCSPTFLLRSSLTGVTCWDVWVVLGTSREAKWNTDTRERKQSGDVTRHRSEGAGVWNVTKLNN